MNTVADRFKEVGRRHHAMLKSETGNSRALQRRDTPYPPVVQALRREPKRVRKSPSSEAVDKHAMLMPMCHDTDIHAALNFSKPSSLVEKHASDDETLFMVEMADRIKQRLAQLDLSQVAAAKAAGISTQRFGNYVQGTRKPDIETLPKIARALNVSTDWLLGISETGPIEISPVILRLLELEGVDPERANVIAAAVQEALRILSSLPDEGDAGLRSRLAAQAAWQVRRSPRPS
jgi:transcriptional regulator with XRE-family HTH domain